MTQALRALTPLGLFALAVAIRALPWRVVLTEDRVFPYGNDAFYHLRRIAYSLANFPAVLDFDRYINFPHGAKPIWTPLFDWTVALLVRPFVPPLAGEAAAEGLDALERIAVWVPPILGGLTVVVAWAIALRHVDRRAALSTGLLLSVLSAHFWYSQIGFLDHHAAVALTSALLLAASMEFLWRERRRGALLASVATGGALALALLVWPGSLLHVALVETALGVYLVTRARREVAAGAARRFALAHGVAALLVLPAGLESEWPQWSRFSPVVLTRFQPWLFASLAALGGASWLLWSRSPAGRTKATRAATGLGLGVALIAISLALFPDLLRGAEDAWRWFAKADTFQAQVAESQPLLVSQGRFTLEIAAMRLSLLFFVFPLVLAAVAVALRRERDRAPLLLLLWFAAGMCAVTLIQKRFFNSFSVPYAIVLGAGAWWLYEALPPWLLESRRGRRVAQLALAALLLGAFAPVLWSYELPVRNAIGALRREAPLVSPHRMRQRRMEELSRWLLRNTPATSGWLDASQPPEYGVLGPWWIGHVVEYRGRRPTVTNPFGDDIGPENFALARAYFLGDEERGSQLLDHLNARYVIASGLANLGRPPPRDSLFMALYFFDGTSEGSIGGASALPPIGALVRHRLIYESGPHPEARGNPLLKLFEHVRGALVAGRAAPGARVRASVPLVTNRGRKLRYEVDAVADRAGRYALRLPYANRGSPPAVRVGRHYVFECEEQRAAVAIGEAAVQQGRRLEGPDLCR